MSRRPSRIPKKRVSKEFKEAVLCSRDPMYRIAALAGLAPAVLSRAINDRELFDPQDKRIKRIAEVIGFEGLCFEKT